jgi:hypothetical protein
MNGRTGDYSKKYFGGCCFYPSSHLFFIWISFSFSLFFVPAIEDLRVCCSHLVGELVLPAQYLRLRLIGQPIWLRAGLNLARVSVGDEVCSSEFHT